MVEDSSDDAEITMRALAQLGLSNKIHWVKDGEQALKLLLSDTNSDAIAPKVILLDLKLPKIDGFEVLASLRNSPAQLKIPVVVLTSSNEESDLVKCYDLGANSYVVKPVDFTKYSSAIKEIAGYWIDKNQVPTSL